MNIRRSFCMDRRRSPLLRRSLPLLLTLLLLVPGPALAAQAPVDTEHINYIVDTFNEVNGLPTGEANTLLQADNGYLWIGSYGGLLRYDGSSFTDFSSRLSSSAIRTLFESSDGTMYIGTNDAGMYRLRDDVFTMISAENEHSFLCIRDFAEAPDGTIYTASTSGIARVDGDTLIPCAFPGMEGEQFLNIAVDRNGVVWAMSGGGTLYLFRGSEYLYTIASNDILPGGMIYSVGTDKNGVIYVGSEDDRILRMACEEEGPTVLAEFSTGDVTTINHLNAADDGTVLVSALNGFGFLDEDGFHRVDTPGGNPLSANWAALDHEGNRWVASSNYGVIRYTVGCFDSCNYNSDLGTQTVNAVTRSGDLFYVGTDNGVLVFDRDWRPVKNALTEEGQGFRVRNVTADADGLVWMATYSEHGVICYDPKTGERTDFGVDAGLNSDKVRVVYPLSDGRMLVGSQLGVNILENGKVTESYGSDSGMENASILCAMELNGRVYVGTDGSGIYEITDDGLVNYGFAEGLSQGVVLRMEPDADGNGNFYVCAGDKLYYYENGYFRELTGIDVGAGSIYDVYDVGGRIWLLQNGGIFTAEKKGLLAGEEVYTSHYGVNCGLTGTLIANTWCWREEDGSLYLPTRNGVSIFYFRGPDVILPRAILNSITVDSEEHEHPDSLTLPSDARRMTVDISELLFSETSEFLLGYRLEGFDATETFTTEKHVIVSYTNLKGGSYSLEVRIINPLTGESTAMETVPIQKEKKITEQAWFYVVCAIAAAVAVAGCVWLVFRHKTRTLLKKQEEQSRYIDEITKVFSQCIDMRDAYTNGHSARVAKYTALLAEKLGKDPDEVERMYHIALLHDVGKISIPDAVLNKPGKLNDEEYGLMKSHSKRGYDVLKSIDISPDLALGACYHHERYDGSGYPAGLKGDEIPEVAQIIAVADTFDAMYSTRPYRKKLPLETVVAEIRRCSGTQLSPKVVDAFLQLVEEGAIREEEDGEVPSPSAAE